MRGNACKLGQAPLADRCRRLERGFTLLEVIVAVAITGLAMIALFQSASIGLSAVDQAGRVEEAIERAQSHLAAYGRVGTIVTGDLEGDDGGGYRWRLSATPVAVRRTAPDEPTGSASTLFDVVVTISWRSSGRQRSVVLETRRLVYGTRSR